MNYTSSCRPGNRCRKWRECDYCAQVRQAQIADVAEAGAATSPSVTYAVARTYSQATISKDRSKFMAKLQRATEGGIWTIEKGEVSAGLHINIIAGTSEPLPAAKLAAMWPGDADFWAAEIPHSDVRNVAAYSAKRSQMPDRAEYSGNIYGSYGSWKRPLAALVEGKGNAGAVAKGLALEQMLADLGIPEPETPDHYRGPILETRPFAGHETKRDREKRADRNIATMQEARAEHERHKREVAARNHMKRLYAIHRGEIELHGYAYIPGYGVVTVADLKAAGFGSLTDSD